LHDAAIQLNTDMHTSRYKGKEISFDMKDLLNCVRTIDRDAYAETLRELALPFVRAY
jgi:hypothetical protein